MESYKSRQIKFEKIIEYRDWRIKLYSITHQAQILTSDLLKVAEGKLGDWLRTVEGSSLVNYKTGFMIVHFAKDGYYILLSWWVNDNMLEHYVYYSPLEKLEFVPFRHNNVIACVWELTVICFEKNAWVERVMKDGLPGNYERYLMDQLNAEF